MRSSYIVEAGVHNNSCQSLFGAGKGKRENGQYTPKGLAPVTCLHQSGLTSQSLQTTNPHKQLKHSNHGRIRGTSISGHSNWYLKKIQVSWRNNKLEIDKGHTGTREGQKAERKAKKKCWSVRHSVHCIFFLHSRKFETANHGPQAVGVEEPEAPIPLLKQICEDLETVGPKRLF